MRYVKKFNINGVETKQVACIELHGAPNAATEGAVGVLGIDVDSPTYDLYKCVAVNGGVYTWKEHGNTPSVGVASASIQENFLDTYKTLVTRKTAFVLILSSAVGAVSYERYRVNQVGVLASPGATVRFVIWKKIDNGDGTYLFRQTGVLGETVADSATGIALLTIDDGYVFEDLDATQGIVAQCADEVIHCSANPYGGMTFTKVPCFEDGDYTTSRDGFEIPFTIGQPDHVLFNALYDIDCMSGKTLDEFATEVDERLSALEENQGSDGGGDSGGDDVTTETPPTTIDLSTLDTEGKIVETFADGSTKTTTMEFDSDGNPTKITDGDGNVTTLTW